MGHPCVEHRLLVVKSNLEALGTQSCSGELGRESEEVEVFLKSVLSFLPLAGIWSSSSKPYGFNVQNFGEK